MERSQQRIHRKDELTWPAHILTCSPHVLSHVLATHKTIKALYCSTLIHIIYVQVNPCPQKLFDKANFVSSDLVQVTTVCDDTGF